MPIGRLLTGQCLPRPPPARFGPVLRHRCSPSSSPRPMSRQFGLRQRSPDPWNSGAPATRAPLLNLDDRTPESLQRAVDPREVGGCTRARRRRARHNQSNDDANQLLPAKSDSAASEVDLVGEERANRQQGANDQHDGGDDADRGSCTGLVSQGQLRPIGVSRTETLRRNARVAADEIVIMRRSRVFGYITVPLAPRSVGGRHVRAAS